MCKILLWLLPVVDIFMLPRVIRYYGSLGVQVPWGHARYGLVERWVGYLPVGFFLGWFAGFWTSLLVAFLVFIIIGPFELYLMCRGTKPWKFFGGKPFELVTKIFLLEGFNAMGYYVLGTLLAVLTGMIFP
ncbi:MAG TPA: hypothetical protein EYP46_00540 [Hadesarchaea archaeon]|nr:hypothetical protein [Hadesarchaea archaeon]